MGILYSRQDGEVENFNMSFMSYRYPAKSGKKNCSLDFKVSMTLYDVSNIVLFRELFLKSFHHG